MIDAAWREHCKGLLSDVISEYLNDDKMTPNHFVEDVKEELNSWMEYHKGQYVKASSNVDLPLPDKPITTNVSPF